ncbi:MAG: hypothetical protein ABIH24_09245 [Verrucomicrobiota bacterium]
MAVELDESNKLRLKDRVRVIYIVDIDSPFLNTALEMAILNVRYGIPCTFNPRLYQFEDDEMNAIIMKILRARKQEIGYQYEELADAKNDLAAARSAFADNIRYLSKNYTINTLMAHGRTGEGCHTADLFKDNDKYRPALWQRFGLRLKADFYYFITTIEGGIYYFNESTRFFAEEYVSTLQCLKPGDIAIMLHHSEYLRKGNRNRPNPKIFKGLDGVAFLFPK